MPGLLLRAALVALLLPLNPMPARPSSSEVDLPMPLDLEADLVTRYWSWLLEEVDAPPGLPWPRIEIAPLPRTVRMAFVYPTSDVPWQEMQIVMSVRSIDRAAGPEHLVVVGELAHELVHYVLVLKENGWDVSGETFRQAEHHHCQPEFMRLTRQVGQFIWDVYHSPASVRSVEHMVRLACWRDGHQIGKIARSE
jgi:hypothetical protein